MNMEFIIDGRKKITINDDYFEIILDYVIDPKNKSKKYFFSEIEKLEYIEKKILWIQSAFRWILLPLMIDINPLKINPNRIYIRMKNGSKRIIELNNKEELLEIYRILNNKLTGY